MAYYLYTRRVVKIVLFPRRTAHQTNDPDQDDYVITDSPKEARPNTNQAAKKSNKNTPQNGQEYSESIDEQLTQQACRSNQDTFLTLKNKPSNTIREILYKCNTKAVAIQADTPVNAQLSNNTTTASSITNKSQKSPDNEAMVSTNAPATQKTITRSKIPVRKKKGPKLTFQIRSPKVDEANAHKAERYRKTPGAKNALRKNANASLAAKTRNKKETTSVKSRKEIAHSHQKNTQELEAVVNLESSAKAPISSKSKFVGFYLGYCLQSVCSLHHCGCCLIPVIRSCLIIISLSRLSGDCFHFEFVRHRSFLAF